MLPYGSSTLPPSPLCSQQLQTRRGSEQGRYSPGPPNHSAVMVYPPPQPQPSPRHDPLTPPGDQGRGVSLPSMGSWAPPPPIPSPRTPLISPGWGSGPPPTNLPGWRDQAFVPQPQSAGRSVKRARDSLPGRQPSDAEEVEAGLALAGLGLGLTAGQVKARRESMSVKSMKKEDETKPGRDGKKSCSECRRLKAKCDRVFPCSNCSQKFALDIGQ